MVNPVPRYRRSCRTLPAPLRDANKKVTGVFVTHRDVTDERRLKTRQIEEKEEHLKEREALLKIIRDRDEELTDLRSKVGRKR